MRKFISRYRIAFAVLGTAVVTLLAVLVVMNFSGAEPHIEKRLERLYAVEDPRFRQELGVLLGPPFVDGNRVQVLRNGDEIFPAMLAAIRGAQQTITFESYIYWSGDIGREFGEALAERARAGVSTHVLLDWIGSSKMDEEIIQSMETAGVEVHKFHPPHWYHLQRMNNRTHRKLLVVDGKRAFTGGVGIAPEWTGNAESPERWRDTHFQVEGPVVAQMQAVFLDNWIKVKGEVLHGEPYFAELEDVGQSAAQMFSSSPTGGAESMQLMYLLSITSAARTIDLSASYFVPDELMLRALVEAMKRGVRLRIVVPGEHIDAETVRLASRAQWGPLLEAGAVIAEYSPTMYHCKVMIIDDLLVSVGSTNFDNRSFRLNDEATLNILDASFAKEQTAIFEADLARSRPISHQEWLNRPLRERLAEKVASLMDSQL